MGQTKSRVRLEDGTDVGEADAAGAAFADAIRRMHFLVRDCDDELRDLSEVANEHGQKSSQFSAAFERLGSCQRRRGEQLAAIEARCGPSQDEFKACVQENGDRAEKCLPVLHKFLDCADARLRS